MVGNPNQAINSTIYGVPDFLLKLSVLTQTIMYLTMKLPVKAKTGQELAEYLSFHFSIII